MIKFENTEVFNFKGAIRGMRNPLNSWDKSDSILCNDYDCEKCSYLDSETCDCVSFKDIVYIGPNDLDLMKRLIKAGSDHRKFMRQILVSVDITAPLYWWKEFDTYKVATVSNSCSTMHKIHDKEFTLEDFSHEHLLQNHCFTAGMDSVVKMSSVSFLQMTCDILNVFRNEYNNEKSPEVKKILWYQMIQLLPTSYNQRRTITLNYETLYNIYGSRRNHKLDEWSIGFMEWIKSLPYANELIIDRS